MEDMMTHPRPTHTLNIHGGPYDGQTMTIESDLAQDVIEALPPDVVYYHKCGDECRGSHPPGEVVGEPYIIHRGDMWHKATYPNLMAEATT